MPKVINLGERCYPGISHKRVRDDHKAKHQFFLPYVRDKYVVDIGCGEGFGSNLLKTSGGAKKVIGVDIDAEIIEEAKQKYPEVDFLVSDGSMTMIPNESADIVIAFDSWHHMDNYDQLPKEVARILHTGGLFIFSVPNRKVLYLNPFRKKMLTEFYRKDFDKKTITKLLGDLFVIEEWYGQRFVKSLYTNPIVKIVFFCLSYVSKVFSRKIDIAYKLANGPAVLPLTGENSRSIIVVARKS